MLSPDADRTDTNECRSSRGVHCVGLTRRGGSITRTRRQGVFWNDLARDLEDAEFFEAYATASLEIAAQDARMSAEEPDAQASGSS